MRMCFSSEIHFLKQWLTSFDGDPVGNLEGSLLKLTLLGLKVGACDGALEGSVLKLSLLGLEVGSRDGDEVGV